MKHISLRLEDSEFSDFEEGMSAAGIKKVQEAGKQALLMAVVAWKKPQEGKVPARLRPYLKKFETLLASGNERIIEAVTSNVDVFSELYDLQKAGGGNASRR
jgi:hypothetical protein